MRFNGIELRTVHPSISINKEIPPGMPDRNVLTVSGADGEQVSDVQVKQGEYTVRVNIACRTKDDAWMVRRLLAGWATSSGNRTAQLEPTHWPGVCYDAIVKDISAPEFIVGFAVVTVRFLLPRPFAHDLAETTTSGRKTVQAGFTGTAVCRPVIRQTMQGSAQELLWTMDGRDMLRIIGPVSGVVEANFGTGELLIDGVHSEQRVDFQRSVWHPGFTPGVHEIVSSDGGLLEVRWKAEWA